MDHRPYITAIVIAFLAAAVFGAWVDSEQDTKRFVACVSAGGSYDSSWGGRCTK